MNFWPLLITIYFFALGTVTVLKAKLPILLLPFLFLFVSGRDTGPVLIIGTESLIFYSLLLLPNYWVRNASVRWRTGIAVVSVGSVMLIGFGGAYVLQRQTAAQIEASLSEDHRQKMPSKIQSIAYYSSIHGLRCDRLCQKLLFNHELKHFIIFRAETPRVRTYWLERREECPDTHEQANLHSAARARIVAGECLMSKDAAVVKPDVSIVIQRKKASSGTGFSFNSGTIGTLSLSIREGGTGGKELFRKTEIKAYPAMAPLFFGFDLKMGRLRIVGRQRVIGKFNLEATLKDALGFSFDEIKPPSDAQTFHRLLTVLDTANTGSEPLSKRDSVILSGYRRKFDFPTPVERDRAGAQLAAALVRKSIAVLGNESAIQDGRSANLIELLESTVWALDWATRSDFDAFYTLVHSLTRDIITKTSTQKGRRSFSDGWIPNVAIGALSKKATLSASDLDLVRDLMAMRRNMEALIKAHAMARPDLLPLVLDALKFQDSSSMGRYISYLGYFSREALLREAPRLTIIAEREVENVHTATAASFLARMADLGGAMLPAFMKIAKSSNSFTRASTYLSICRLPPKFALSAADLLLEALSNDGPKHRGVDQPRNAVLALVRMGKKKEALRVLSKTHRHFILRSDRELIENLEKGFDRTICQPKYYPYPDA